MTFGQEEEVVSPEGVGPSVGRLRNMVHTAAIPVRQRRVEGAGGCPPPSVQQALSRLAPTGRHSWWLATPSQDLAPEVPSA